MSDATFKGLLIIIGFIICRRILVYISHKLAIINITYNLKKLLKKHSIVKDIKLIENSKQNHLIFNAILDSGELVIETLIGNDPKKTIKDSIGTFIYDLYHDHCWYITVNFIDD